MKSILTSLLFLATFPLFSFADENIDQQPHDIGIAVLDFDNRTGPSGQRIVPGIYFDQQDKRGFENTAETYVQDGKKVQRVRQEDIYKGEVNRLTEISPGQWTLPASANAIAADELSASLSELPDYSIMRSKRIADPDDTANLIKYYRKDNARYIITGSLSNYRIDRKTINAYGIDRTTATTTITIDVKVIDTQTGKIVYQDSPTQVITTAIPGEVSDFSEVYDWQGILRTVVRNASGNMIIALTRLNPYQLNVTPGSTYVPPSKATYTLAERELANPIPTVVIKIDSTPQGADILLDGVFVGNTPAQIKVSEGEKKLTLKLRGYTPWENTIFATHTFTAKPKLQKASEPQEAPPLPKNTGIPSHDKKDISIEVK